MKNKIISVLTVLFLFLSFSLAAKEKTQTEPINEKTGFPEITDKPYVMFNEGLSCAMVNRVEKLEDRSNFVREDYMLGIFGQMQTVNMKPLDSILTLSLYYPFYHTFNGMKQDAKQLLLYAVDLYYGLLINMDMWKYVNIKMSAGLHYMYNLTDEYHMHYLGPAVLLGLELPLAKNWSIIVNGSASLDYPNLGTNAKIQPFDFSWQYHLNTGFRFTLRGANKFSYINSRPAKK